MRAGPPLWFCWSSCCLELVAGLQPARPSQEALSWGSCLYPRGCKLEDDPSGVCMLHCPAPPLVLQPSVDSGKPCWWKLRCCSTHREGHKVASPHQPACHMKKPTACLFCDWFLTSTVWQMFPEAQRSRWGGCSIPSSPSGLPFLFAWSQSAHLLSECLSILFIIFDACKSELRAPHSGVHPPAI